MIKPISCTIEITLRCNLRCKTCFANSSLKADAPEIPISKLSSLVDELATMGIKSFLLEGGEPTIHRDFPLLLECFSKQGVKPGIATNGTLLNDELCLRMHELGLRHNIYVSLDGVDAETYQLVRNNNAFSTVIKGINCLQKYGIHFAVSMVVVKYNISQIPKMYELARSLGASFLNLIRFNLEGRGVNNADELQINESSFDELCIPWIEKWGGRMGFFGENCILPIDPQINLTFPNEDDLRRFVVIHANGDVKLGRASGGVPIGNCLSSDGFKGVWHGEEAKKYLSNMTSTDFFELIQYRRKNLIS
jgi:MoaA/NifB/PqqE/SkfB family radical SAM enzyme